MIRGAKTKIVLCEATCVLDKRSNNERTPNIIIAHTMFCVAGKIYSPIHAR